MNEKDRFRMSNWGGGLSFHALMPEVAEAPANTYFDMAATRFHYSPAAFPVATAALSAGRLLLGSDYRLLWAKWVNEQAPDALGEEAAQSVQHASAQRLTGL